MTVILLPLPDGHVGDEAERLQQVIHAIRGFAGQGIQFDLTEYSHATQYALRARNEHTAGGGRHFAAYLSSANVASATPIFAITDAAVTSTIPVTTGNLTVNGTLSVSGIAATGNLTVNGTLSVSGIAETGNLTVNNTLTTLDDAIVGGTLFVDEGIDILGGGTVSGAVTFTAQLISTLATGTAPFAVASTTQVTNLNAQFVGGRAPGTGVGNLAFYDGSGRVADSQLVDGRQPGTGVGDLAFYDGAGRVADSQLLDGLDSTAFAVSGHNHDSTYVNVTGDTITGSLTIQTNLAVDGSLDIAGESTLRKTTITGNGAGNDQALYLQHGTGDGVVTLGATNSLTPDLIIKNNAGTQIGTFTNGGIFKAGSLTTTPGTANDGDVVTSDLWLVDGANYRRLFANGTSFQISENAGSGVHLTIGSTGTLTVPGLQVDDDVNITDALTVGGRYRANANYDLGDGIPTSTTNSDGHWAVSFGGNIRYIPFYNST